MPFVLPPDAITVTLIGLPLGVLNLIQLWSRARSDAWIQRQKLLLDQINGLNQHGDEQDGRLDSMSKVLQDIREDYLEEKEGRLRAEGENIILRGQLKDCQDLRAKAKRVDSSERERQEATTLALQLQNRLNVYEAHGPSMTGAVTLLKTS